MEPNTQKPQDIVDTTDSLEAVSACRSMKNFLFFVILICLLLPQITFWLNQLGLIDTSENMAVVPTGSEISCVQSAPSSLLASMSDKVRGVLSAGPVPLAAEVDIAQEVEKVTEQVQQDTATDETEPVDDVILQETEAQMSTEAESPEGEPVSKTETEASSFRIPGYWVKTVVAVCNFFVIAGSILYCLTLLICLKISLAGRLGGMNHITKAFFISLLLVIFVIPWQQLLPGVLLGAVWLPGELLSGEWADAQNQTVVKILFYLRFCALWFIAIWFLFWAQSRTGKWARATLRRLGVAR